MMGNARKYKSENGWNKFAPGKPNESKDSDVIADELDALSGDANREMDLPEGEDWGDK